MIIHDDAYERSYAFIQARETHVQISSISTEALNQATPKEFQDLAARVLMACLRTFYAEEGIQTLEFWTFQGHCEVGTSH